MSEGKCKVKSWPFGPAKNELNLELKSCIAHAPSIGTKNCVSKVWLVGYLNFSLEVTKTNQGKKYEKNLLVQQKSPKLIILCNYSNILRICTFWDFLMSGPFIQSFFVWFALFTAWEKRRHPTGHKPYFGDKNVWPYKRGMNH